MRYAGPILITLIAYKYTAERDPSPYNHRRGQGSRRSLPRQHARDTLLMRESFVPIHGDNADFEVEVERRTVLDQPII